MSAECKQEAILDGLVAWLAGIQGIGDVGSKLIQDRSELRLPALQAVPGNVVSEDKTLRVLVERVALFAVYVICDGTDSIDSQTQAMRVCAQVVNRVELIDDSTSPRRWLGIPREDVAITHVLALNIEPTETAEEAARNKRKWVVEVAVTFNHARGQA